MKTKAATLILLILVSFCATASAQGYSVRVTYNTNLRTSHSLQSAVAETVGADTILEVMSQFNRWLEINRGGRSLWLADWVPMTRVADAPAQQKPANIDNCCHVDRQCRAESEWTDGYWAFQRNECPSPAPAQPETPAQPSAVSPADVDNCCFFDWACHSDDDWKRGYQAYQSNRCDASPTVLSGIRVEGTDGFKALVGRALDFLQTHSAKWYHYVITGLNVVIEVNPPAGDYQQGVIVQSATFRFNLAKPYIPIPDDDYTMAEVLVHEACHVHRYRAGLPPGGYPGEKACVEMELALWREAPPLHRGFIDRKLRYLANIHRRECQHWLPPVPGGCPYW